MKLLTICFLCGMILFGSTKILAQRKIGNTRSDQTTAPAGGSSSRGDRGAAPATTTPAPVHYAPAPTVIQPPVCPPPPVAPYVGGVAFDDANDRPAPVRPVIYAVSTGNNVASNVSTNDDIELYDSWRVPGQAGYDFSNAAVVPCDDQSSDMYFTYEGGVGSMSVDDDTDIQDLGDVQALGGSRKIPGDGWSSSHVVPVVAGHAYAVWGWDGKCSRFMVSDVTPQSVVFSWVSMGTIPRRTHGPMFER